MESNLKSLSKIFNERLYRIPDYQRGYAWTLKQVKDFWGDIVQLEEDKMHYVGVITLEDVKSTTYSKWEEDTWIIDGKSYEPYYVVDGQQRLTTSVILICSIYEVAKAKKIKNLNYTELEAIKQKYIVESHGGDISRSYVFGYEKDNPSYEFLKSNIFGETSASGYSKEETIYTNNLSRSKDYFIEKLTDLNETDIEKIYKKLTQQLLFNIYSIRDDIDVFIAFETMNNRGLRLSNLELLKNRLIYLSTKFDINDNDKVELRRIINESWKSIYHYLGKNKDNPLSDDVFLRNHTLRFFGTTYLQRTIKMFNGRKVIQMGYDSISEELSARLLEGIFSTKSNAESEEFNVDPKSIKSYVEDIADTVRVWYELRNPSVSKMFNNDEKLWLDKLNRLNNSFQNFSPLMLEFYSKKPTKPESLEFLKRVEKYCFLMYTSNGRMRTGSDEYKDLFSTNTNRKVQTILKSFDKMMGILESDLNSDGIGYRFETLGFYDWIGTRYFLYEYELHLQAQTKTKKLKIDWAQYIDEADDFITVEHIYPKSGSDTYWSERFSTYSSTQKRKLRDSVGNLLPLSKPKNSSLQNKSFDLKVDDGTKIGYRYGSYSEIDVSRNKEWTPVQILERGIELMNFMEKRWDVKIGDDQAKIKALRLEFLQKDS